MLLKPNEGANGPCPCGSNKKYKKCCRDRDLRTRSTRRLAPGAIAKVLLTARAHFNTGAYPLCASLCREVLEALPQQCDAAYLLGLIAMHAGDLPESESLLRLALANRPVLNNAAADAARQARQRLLAEEHAQNQVELARVLFWRGKHDEALALCVAQQSSGLRQAGADELRGAILAEHNQSAAAIAAFDAALANAPGAVTHNNLGMLLAESGLHEQALPHFARATELDPGLMQAHSNLLFAMSHMEAYTPAQVFDAHRRVGALMSARAGEVEAPVCSRDGRRPLRIGFVSADLRRHPVAQVVEPLWMHWRDAGADAGLEVWVYHNSLREDEVSARLRTLARNWRQVIQLDDAALARQIRADGIDILIDLSGHSGHNRLPMFALKPAPLQASWLGYPGSTGLEAIDYYLADRHTVPPGDTSALFTEQVVRLPALCHFPVHALAPPVNALPALQRGQMTFASFNRAIKLGDAVIALWCRVLMALPGARMLLAPFDEDASRARMAERFARHGVAPERLTFMPKTNMADYLALHHDIDMILDTFPYSGGTTTAHALSMGVPVLTLAGATMTSRQSAAILHPVGLAPFVAGSGDEFVAIACSWAGRLPELDALRAGMRHASATAPHCDPALIASAMAVALRRMWQRWCDGEVAQAFEMAA
jgi:predicted O-linked N-acetylglucosamine transferase (SPINDLY family)